MDKLRSDRLLVLRGLAASRTKAQAAILAGQVFSADRPIRGVSELLARNAPLDVRGPAYPFVSRGGVKLAHALDHFGIDPAGAVALDLGASTGGFTDVLLRRGAARVYAVDVGHGQLAPEIARDPRVVCLERVNARAVTREQVPEAVDLITCDVSFISLTLALPPALCLAKPGGRVVALIKPQFEVGPRAIGKGGIVRDPIARQAACDRLLDWLGNRPGWVVEGVTDSPVQGGSGNVEYLLAAHLAP